MDLINKIFFKLLIFIDYFVNVLLSNKYTTRMMVFVLLITLAIINLRYLKKARFKKPAKRIFLIGLEVFLIIYILWFIWIHIQMAVLKS